MGGDIRRILVTGASGQIGSELIPRLRKIYGKENVIASDLRKPTIDDGPFELLDVTDANKLDDIVEVFREKYLGKIGAEKTEKNILAIEKAYDSF